MKIIFETIAESETEAETEYKFHNQNLCYYPLKKLAFTAVVLMVCFKSWFAFSQLSVPESETELGPMERGSDYVMGAVIARDTLLRWETRGEKVDRDQLIQGFMDWVSGESSMSEEELKLAYEKISKERAERERVREEQESEANLKLSQSYLEANRLKAGVTQLPSGLQIETLQDGFGESPGPKDKVVCYIKATTFQGSILDDDFKSGKPSRFQLGFCTAALSEAIPKMKIGAHWRITAPPGLVYGKRGLPPKAPGNMGVVYEVQLLHFVGQINEISAEQETSILDPRGSSVDLGPR